MLQEMRKVMSKVGIGLAFAMLAGTFTPAQDVTKRKRRKKSRTGVMNKEIEKIKNR